MRLWLAQGHRRWDELAAAFVDGELGPAELRRFDEHLGSCARCQETVAAQRATKRLLAASLPEVAAPRSFALTPAMLGAASEPVMMRERSRRPVLLMRMTQAAAAVAVFGFGLALAIDLSGGQESSTTGGIAPASFDTAERTSGGAAESALGLQSPEASDSARDDDAPVPQGTPSPPQYTPGGGGAQAVPTLQPGATTVPPRSGPADNATKNGGPADMAPQSTSEQADREGTAAVGDAVVAGEDEGGIGGPRLAEIAFAVLGIVAVTGWAVAWRRQRS